MRDFCHDSDALHPPEQAGWVVGGTLEEEHGPFSILPGREIRGAPLKERLKCGKLSLRSCKSG